MTKKNLKKINSSGFTLVELLVTLSIFAITTGIVMTSQGKFDNSILLTNTAYDIVITIRQAQTYGVNIKEGVSVSGTTGFNPYGVVFNMSNYKKFNFFEDVVTKNYKYDGDFICTTSDIECVNSYKIKRGHYIKSICAGTNDTECDLNPKDTLNISFQRPNPESIILADNDVYSPTTDSRKNYAKIVISSADGSAERSIIITKVGQIYVKNN